MKIGTFLSDPAGINLPGAPGVGGVPQSTPNDFGASIGVATQLAGRSLVQTGMAFGDVVRKLGADEKEARNKQIAADSASAVGKFDFSADYLDMTTKAGERPENFGTTVGNAYDAKMDGYLDTIKDNDVRREARKNLAARREIFVQQANAFQNRSIGDASVRDANDGINTQVNSVRTDPSLQNYETASKNIDNIIDNRPGLTGDVKGAMRTHAQQMLVRRRFEAMIESTALDPTALDGVKAEMQQPMWRDKMSNADYDKLLDNVTTLSKAANSQEVALARSALSSVHQRNQDGVILSPDELSAVQATVVKSGRAELMSQFALIKRSQDIYREFQGLPLDQMRAKIEDMRKRGGISALPQPVQDGVNQGAALTNGRIGSEFLAGLVNAEYSAADIAAGNYGKQTGSTLPDGRRASDATGVAQFIGPTWRATLRAHADVLGIDASKSDAELDAMRSDPTLSIKAAALHALDNKNAMEGRIGRPVSDGDLYFAHFLGVNGAIRFLQGADANPNTAATAFVDKDQVDANRGVFYDAAGKPRTASQVRVYMTDKMMNGPSRIDYAGVKAGEMVLKNTVQALKDDPITFAATVGRWGPVGDMQSDEGIKRRGVVAMQIAEQYGIPAAQLKPLTKSEVETLGAQARDGTAEETLAVMSKTAALGSPDTIRAANRQIGEKDSLYGFASSAVVTRPDMQPIAADIIRGEKRLKTDKDIKTFVGTVDSDILSTFNATVGKAIIGTTEATTIRQAALAYYVENSIARGDARPGVFNTEGFKDAIHAVLGGNANPGKLALASVNGQTMLLPPGLSEGTFTTALRRMSIDDYNALSKWGGPPRYGDGKIIEPAEIARSGQFEALGGGEYRIKMGDGKYALSAAYKDGSADFYIFRGDPGKLLEAAGRQPNVAPLPSMVPGVQPARPRGSGNAGPGGGRSGRRSRGQVREFDGEEWQSIGEKWLDPQGNPQTDIPPGELETGRSRRDSPQGGGTDEIRTRDSEDGRRIEYYKRKPGKPTT